MFVVLVLKVLVVSDYRIWLLLNLAVSVYLVTVSAIFRLTLWHLTSSCQ